MKLSEIGLPNVLPPALAPYAKIIYGVVTAVATAFFLLALGKFGVNVDQEIIDAGPESQEITWSQAWNALLPLAFAYLVPNGAVRHDHESETSPDDDGRTTLGTETSEHSEGAGPRGEASQA